MERKRMEEIAANRLCIITPLFDPAMDKAKHQLVKEHISIQYGINECTISDEIIDAAITLRREVPKRSVAEIIRMLEWEGLAEPGFIKHSTLQDQLALRGYSSRQMMTYAKDVTSARRFQKPWRNYLWQSDIKYGIYVNGKPTYMVCFIDDCTRMVMHSEFYDTLDQSIVQDCFRKTLAKFGAPDSVYFDNGKQFRTHWMKRACGKLGIRLLYARLISVYLRDYKFSCPIFIKNIVSR